MKQVTENTLINGKKVADYETRWRGVMCNGEKYVLVNQAWYECNRLDPEDEYYYAYAVRIGDDIGQMEIPGGKFPYTNLYVVEWDLSPTYNPDDADEGDACEWDKPRVARWFALIDLTDGRDF